MTEDTIDLLALLDELRVIGRNGLLDAETPYDRERNERLLELASEYYGKAVGLPPEEIRDRLAGDLGYATAKVGAGVAVFNDADELLVIERADSGAWSVLAGGVEPNESAVEAAVRETREETGVEVDITDLVGVYSEAPGESGPHSIVTVLYLGERTGGSPRPSHETTDVRYLSVEAVPVWHPGAREIVADAVAVRSARDS